MDSLSSFTHPNTIPILNECYLGHKRLKNLKNVSVFFVHAMKVVLDPTEFHCMDKNSSNILQNIVLCVAHKKGSPVGLEQRDGE